jgi:hypothetical protein
LKEYKIRRPYIWISVILPTILLIGVTVWGVYTLATDSSDTLARTIVIAIPILLAYSVLTVNQPTKVTDDGETIALYAFGRKHEYAWNDVKTLKVKRFIMTDKVLLQIGEYRMQGGRYWLELGAFEDGEELFNKLVSRELELHPEEAKKYTTNRTRRMKK